MANDLRRIGQNIEQFANNVYHSIEEFANAINLSVNDTHRLFEGRLVLTPLKLKEISRVLSVSLSELLNTEGEYSFVDCMGSFSNKANEDFIINIIDDYIDLIEDTSRI